MSSYQSGSEADKKNYMDSRCQEITNALAQAHQAKAALITELDGNTLIVRAASNNPEHGHQAGDLIARGPNIFCFRVIDSGQPLVVESKVRDANNNGKTISYFGHPVYRPDQSLFGTICILEAETSSNRESVGHTIEKFTKILERDLAAACA